MKRKDSRRYVLEDCSKADVRFSIKSVSGNGGYAPAPATPLPALRRELYAADALRPPVGCGVRRWNARAEVEQ